MGVSYIKFEFLTQRMSSFEEALHTSLNQGADVLSAALAPCTCTFLSALTGISSSGISRRRNGKFKYFKGFDEILSV